MIPLIIIQGPTASGKSSLAIELAEIMNTEIISSDSRQIYKYMDIGTAKVSIEDQNRIKHHLIDIIKPDQQFSAGQFVDLSKKVINKLITERKIPIICGGTGLYIKALLEGIFKIDDISQDVKEKVNHLLTDKGIEYLYSIIKNFDIQLSEQIYPQDKQRIIRACEVWFQTGKSLREHWSNQLKEDQFEVFNILLQPERDILYQRINQRMDQMINNGLIDELRTLLSLGYHSDHYGLNTVGYKEFLPYLTDNNSLADCVSLAKQHSRNYAKRQITWYKKCNFQFAIYNNCINLLEIKKMIDQFFNHLN